MEAIQATVTKTTGTWVTVIKEDGEEINCRVQGKFRLENIKNTSPVVVGDKVEIITEEDGTGTINKIEPRKNYIIRKATKLSKQTHILAANIDQALIIVTFSIPETHTAFIDRFLVTAEAYNIPAILVFNKADLYEEYDLKRIAYLSEVYENAGYQCITVSAKEKTNIDELKVILANKTSLLCGHSGVGKSSIINAIDPTLDLKTANISVSHLSGKHTTTFAEMHILQSGIRIIDTPGIKSFGIVDFQKEELYHYFPEIFKISTHCNFNNCIHINEPGCAVKKAVEENRIAEHRYKNYYNMYHDKNLKYR